MRRLLQALAISIVAGAALALLPAQRASACRCVERSEAEALAGADVVFEGVVADGEAEVFLQNIGVGDTRFTFAVQNVIKGEPLAPRIHVSTAGNGAACGAGFAVAQRWRVHASGDTARLTSSLCSGNQLLAERAPIPQPPTAAPTGVIPAAVLVALGVVGLLVLASLLAFRRVKAPDRG
jgi:hypothetical protein